MKVERSTSVRAYAAADLPQAQRIVTAAFGKSLTPLLETRLSLASTRGFVAECDDAIVGFATLSVYGTIAYAGSMAVDPARQHRGAGSALMAALIDYCSGHGIASLALDATAAGAPLYAKFGFLDTDRTIVLERKSPIALSLGPAHDRHGIERAKSLDRTLLDCDRSDVLAMLANVDGATAIVERDGYGIAWHGTIGPLLARTPATARAILTRLVRENEPIVRMLVPEATPHALELAAEHGFTIERVVAHMVRGESPFTRTCIYARASHSHG